LSLKILVSGFPGFGLKTDIYDLGIKITVTVSWFGHQNQAGNGLSVAPQNRWKENGTGHASRSSGLLRLQASQVRVSQFASKLVDA
jgi:hypothetical protein